jgi:hypothetical protein
LLPERLVVGILFQISSWDFVFQHSLNLVHLEGSELVVVDGPHLDCGIVSVKTSEKPY